MKLENDIYFIQLLQKKEGVTPETIYNYKSIITDFCTFINKPFHEFIKETKEEQQDYIKDNKIIRYDEDTGQLATYIYEYRDYLKNEKANKNTSINNKLKVLKTICRVFKIKFPHIKELPDDADEWYLLSKEDIKNILYFCTPQTQTIVLFITCTGRRARDVIQTTIQDFMDATYEYHECSEVDDFLDKAPQDMVGTWVFYPNKTKNYKQICIHGNTPQLSNLLLNLLKERRRELEKEGIKLKKSDPLFRSTRTKTFYSKNGIGSILQYPNEKFYRAKCEQYNQEFKKGLISAETLKQKIKEIPNFHPHALRKYYSSVVAEYCSNIRICAVLEGHAMPLKTDKNYIKLTREKVKEEYFNIIPYLSFEPTQVKILTSEKVQRYEEKLADYERKLSKYENNFKESEDKINERLDTLEKLKELSDMLDDF